jgi:Tol biopolymer transport system component
VVARRPRLALLEDVAVTLRPFGAGRERRLGLYGYSLSWSPDAKALAIGRASTIYVYRLGASRPVLLTRNAMRPAWSPDGRKLAFVRSLGQGNDEIYVMDADGSHRRRLTFNPGPDEAPDWQPVRG